MVIHTYQLTLESNPPCKDCLTGIFKVNYDGNAIILEPWSLWSCEYTVNSRAGAWARSLRPAQTLLMEKGRIPLSPWHQNKTFVYIIDLLSNPKLQGEKCDPWKPNFSLSCCSSPTVLSLPTERAGRPLPELESAIMGWLNANGWKQLQVELQSSDASFFGPNTTQSLWLRNKF